MVRNFVLKKVNDDNDMLIRIETVFVKYASWSLFMSSWNMAMILCKRILFLYMEFKSVVCFWRIVQIFCKWVEFVITVSIWCLCHYFTECSIYIYDSCYQWNIIKHLIVFLLFHIKDWSLKLNRIHYPHKTDINKLLFLC